MEIPTLSSGRPRHVILAKTDEIKLKNRISRKSEPCFCWMFPIRVGFVTYDSEFGLAIFHSTKDKEYLVFCVKIRLLRIRVGIVTHKMKLKNEIRWLGPRFGRKFRFCQFGSAGSRNPRRPNHKMKLKIGKSRKLKACFCWIWSILVGRITYMILIRVEPVSQYQK